MPEMGGIEAAQKIRASQMLSKQPIIVAITANAFPEDRYSFSFVLVLFLEMLQNDINSSNL